MNAWNNNDFPRTPATCTRLLAGHHAGIVARVCAALIVCGSITATPTEVHATKGEPEQLIPDTLPINGERLWFGIRPQGTGAVHEGRARTPVVIPADWAQGNYTPLSQPRRGHTFDFPSITKPVRFQPNGGALLPSGAGGASPSGLTVSVWYKKTWPYDGTGWFPVWALGNATGAESWRMALVLKNGVPVISLRHQSYELFSSQSVPQDATTPRIDDSQWHHVLLRVTRESCPGRCPSVVDVGYPAQPARFTLYVDGQWRGEEVALAPLDLNQLDLGKLDVDKPYEQLNYRTSPRPYLESFAFLDDVLLFDAPLSDFEIVKLHEWTSVGYMAQYPLAPKDTLLAGQAGRSEQRVQVGEASVPPSDLFAVASTVGSLIGSQEKGQFPDGTTTFAWVRSDAATALFQFDAGNASLWVSQAETGFSVICLSNGTSANAPFHTDPRNRFQLIALTRLGNTATFYQDGAKIASLECPAATGPVDSKVGFSMGNGAAHWLAWTGSFDAVLNPNQLDRRVASGPRLWNGTAPNATALVDLTGRNMLRVEKASETDTVLGGLVTNDNRTAANGGVAPGRPSGVFARADGTLHPGDGTTPFTVSFTVQDKTTPTVDYAFSPVRRTLARRAFVDRSGFLLGLRDNFSVTERCAPFQACILEIVVGVGPGRPGRKFEVRRKVVNTDPMHITIAYGEPRVIPPSSWRPGDPSVTRLEPIVVINGELQNQSDQGAYNGVVDVGEVPALPATVPTAEARWSFGPGFDGVLARLAAPVPGTGTAVLQNDPASTPWVIEMTDIRVYSHVHRDIEAIGLDRTARCTEAGRAIVATTGPFHGNYCGECQGANFLIGGATVPTRECRLHSVYGEECVTSAECEGGAACWKGSCLTTSQAVCDEECGQLGRTCVAEGASKRCGGCKAGLTPNAGNRATADSWELGCNWQPTKKGGDTCSNDGECVTGWCLPAQSGTLPTRVLKGQGSQELSKSDRWGAYTITCRKTAETFAPTLTDLAWNIPGRCAFEQDIGGQTCRKMRTTQLERTSTAPDGSQVVGIQCLDGPNGQCLPGFEHRYRLLDPQACRAMLAASTQSIDGECDVNWVNSKTDRTTIVSSDRRNAVWFGGYDFSLNTLKRAVLGETSPYVLADRSRLINAGVGPLVMEFAAANNTRKEAMINEFGDISPLRACAADFSDRAWGTGRVEAYEHANTRVCEPILRPNGATCPPPGTEGTGTQPWQFCESSFCDVRGTGTCTDGGKQRAEAEGDGGNKQREGKSAVKFGVVRVDDTRIEVIRSPATAMADTNPKYTANLSQVHVPCILGTKFPPVDLLNISAFIDKSQPECAESRFNLQVLGFTLNPPPPKPVAGSCTAVQSVAGAAGRVCDTSTSCEPPTVSDLMNTLSWASLLPNFTFCLPLDKVGVKMPKKTKTFLAGPVPITISIGLTLDPCISASFGFASQGSSGGESQSGLPQLEVKPSLGIGVEAKAGVGAEEDNPVPPGAGAAAGGAAAAAAAAAGAGKKAGGGDTIGASVGVKIALTIIELGFPIRWGLRLEDVYKDRVKVPGLFRLEMFTSISMSLEYLSGWMGIYATLSLGVIGIDWTLKLFSWTGLSSQIPIASGGFPLYTIDFRAELEAALAGQQVPPRANCDGNACVR